MNIQRKAFTMIEIVFVIVILGILSSVAISKMAVTRDDAQIVKGKANVVAIRNAITLTRSTNMLQALGNGWPGRLDALTTATSNDGDELFGHDTNGTDDNARLLDYAISSKDSNGHWRKVGASTYTFKVMNEDINFTYTANNGRFVCSTTTGTTSVRELCRNLTQ